MEALEVPAGAGAVGLSLEPLPSACLSLVETRAAQRAWAEVGVSERLRLLRRARGRMVAEAGSLAEAVPLDVAGSLHRNLADTVVAEVLPLIEACRFLEREAEEILRSRLAGTGSRPLWLRGVAVEVRREPVGLVLIIAPGNYPLLLPGVQALQALAAGNAVLWKPAPGGTDSAGPGCRAAALALQAMLVASGLDPLLLRVLDESQEAAKEAISAGVDKVVLTGSAATGRAVYRELAESLTPAVMELSGCDAVLLLDGADLNRAAAAIAFGLRLNGSATCMAPRRLFSSAATAELLLGKLVPLLEAVEPVKLTDATARLVRALIEEAEAGGAVIIGGGVVEDRMRPTLIVGATAEMRIAKTDIAAPMLSVIEVRDEDAAVAAYAACPYALTASIFGTESRAVRLARRIRAGVVVVNDLIVATADPRVAFGGRGGSGFGVTRGREGLLEMTALKTVVVQGSRDLRAYQPVGGLQARLFLGYLQMAHATGFRDRLAGLVAFGKAAVSLGRDSR